MLLYLCVFASMHMFVHLFTSLYKFVGQFSIQEFQSAYSTCCQRLPKRVCPLNTADCFYSLYGKKKIIFCVVVSFEDNLRSVHLIYLKRCTHHSSGRHKSETHNVSSAAKAIELKTSLFICALLLF